MNAGTVFAAVHTLHQAGATGTVHLFNELDAIEVEDVIQMLSKSVGLWGGDRWTGSPGVGTTSGRPLVTLLLRQQDVDGLAYLAVTVGLRADTPPTTIRHLHRTLRGQSCQRCGQELGWEQWRYPVPDGNDDERLCATCEDSRITTQPADAAL